MIVYLFGYQNIGVFKEVRDPAQDPQYAEYEVDAMRTQKNQVCHLVASAYIAVIKPGNIIGLSQQPIDLLKFHILEPL